MVEMSVYFIALCNLFVGSGISDFIETVIDFIKKGKWYAGVIYTIVLVILYFFSVEVFKCILK